MSAARHDPVRLALGRVGVDRRADLRAAGWAAVPGRRRIVLLDATGEAAVRFAADRSATLATVDEGVGDQPGPVEAPTQAGGPPDTPSEDVFLGLASDGAALCGRVVERDGPLLPAGAQWASLRSVGLALPDDARAAFAEFLALANWHRTHPRCPRCGGPTQMAGLGWWRTCPQDSSEHYPRTDPAVIAVLVDSEGNALLGRQVRWPVGAYSTLAGFVEPGESAEAAVVREIAEEVGLRPDTVTYVASQPWPFPASLMLGFRATIDAVRPEPRVDGTEIAEARWISRSELPVLCEAGEVRLPGRLSIAHHLVRGWFGADLPDSWCRW